jgi:hypothetical protein
MNKFLFPFLLLFAGTATAQTAKIPVRMEQKTTTFIETNSKYGSQKRTKTEVFIVYSDSSKALATAKKLKPIISQMPIAQYEWQKWQRSNRQQLMSFPALAAGFVGAILAVQPQTRQEGILIGGVGLGTGIWSVSHFEFKKRKYERRLIEVCNQYLKGDRPFEDLRSTSPDVMRVGLTGSGVGLIWQFGQ